MTRPHGGAAGRRCPTSSRPVGGSRTSWSHWRSCLPPLSSLLLPSAKLLYSRLRHHEAGCVRRLRSGGGELIPLYRGRKVVAPREVVHNAVVQLAVHGSHGRPPLLQIGVPPGTTAVLAVAVRVGGGQRQRPGDPGLDTARAGRHGGCRHVVGVKV